MKSDLGNGTRDKQVDKNRAAAKFIGTMSIYIGCSRLISPERNIWMPCYFFPLKTIETKTFGSTLKISLIWVVASFKCSTSLNIISQTFYFTASYSLERGL